MLSGINHITLSVHNLEQSLEFYTDTLGCRLVAKWEKGSYLLVGDLWLCLIVDSKTRLTSLPEYTHIAFQVAQKDLAKISEKIKNSGAVIWKDNTSEGDSLYFLDPNGHKLEIHSNNLQDRLKACKKAPYKNMIFFDF